MAATKVLRRSWGASGPGSSLVARGLATVVPKVSQVDNSSGFLGNVPHRQHPGILHLKSVRLPPELVQTAHFLVAQSSMRDLEKQTKALTNYLWSRKRPLETVDLRRKALQVEQKLREVSVHAHPKGSLTQLDDSKEKKLQRKVLDIIRKTTYHWETLDYTEELSFVYMAARMDGVFAAVSRAFHEIQKRVKDFQPCTLLDFGSGTGAVSWAAHSIWGKTMKEYMNIDTSAPMLALAERLMKGTSEDQEPCFPGVYFRQFLPVSPKVKFDLVVSAFSLNELPSQAQRVETVQTLWRKTDGFLGYKKNNTHPDNFSEDPVNRANCLPNLAATALTLLLLLSLVFLQFSRYDLASTILDATLAVVLIENGTKEGHQMLMEARDVVLKGKDKVVHDSREPHIFAPCPHHLPCPRLSPERPLPCNFIQAYYPLPFSWNPKQKEEKFSFLILRRGPGESEEPWPRITQPVLCRPRHVHVHLCCPDGTLQHAVVTPKKHGRDFYRCARSSQCGDRLPVLNPDSEPALGEEDSHIDEEQS